MTLRRLDIRDAENMLEWMHDPTVVKNMRTDFKSKTIDDCEDFINSANETSENLHLAIVNERDEYMGTVSLKNIHESAAEFGITLRRCAMGKGYSSFAMREIIELGFNEKRLHNIYWCVDPENKRAIHFYEKNGFQRCDVPEDVIGYTDEEKRNYCWYNIDNT